MESAEGSWALESSQGLATAEASLFSLETLAKMKSEYKVEGQQPNWSGGGMAYAPNDFVSI